MQKNILIVVLAGLAALGVVYFWPASGDANAPQEILAEPHPLTAFTLTRHERAPLNLETLKGKWTFLFFGYTHCPDVCPTTLSELNAAHELLAADPGVLDNTQFVFVSVDPERDTPESLATYVAYFNAAFSAATGTPAELSAITRQLGIEHSRGETSASGYVVNHSSAVLLIDPQVRYYARLKAPHYAEDIRSQFLAIRRYYEENL